MVIDRSTIPLEMLGEPDDTECPHGIPTGMGVECWECRYDNLKIDYDSLDDEIAALEQRCGELEAERDEWKRVATEQAQLHTDDTANLQTSLEKAESESERLRKRLEPIDEWWERNCSDYIRKKHEKWDASMYEVIHQCMELKRCMNSE